MKTNSKYKKQKRRLMMSGAALVISGKMKLVVVDDFSNGYMNSG